MRNIGYYNKKMIESAIWAANSPVEVWRPIPGYENYYQVSSMGNVKSLPRKVYRYNNGIRTTIHRKGIIRSTNLNNVTGYHSVTLSVDNIRIRYYIHRLVLSAFIGLSMSKKRNDLLHIDHIDNDKGNNKLINLQLVSARFNVSKSSKSKTSHMKGVKKKILKNGGVSWHSQIIDNGKYMHLGVYDTEQKAHDAYMAAAMSFGNLSDLKLLVNFQQ